MADMNQAPADAPAEAPLPPAPAEAPLPPAPAEAPLPPAPAEAPLPPAPAEAPLPPAPAEAPLPPAPAEAPLPPAPAEAPLPPAPTEAPLPPAPAEAPLPPAPAEAPLPLAPAVGPLPEVPAVAPLPQAPAVAPLPQAPAVGPLPEVPVEAPLPPAPAEAPLPLAPAVGPLPEVPAVAPLPQAPAVAPLPQAPAVAPLPQAPAVAPLPLAPAVGPLPEVPAAAPLPQAPAVAPLPQAPAVAPLPLAPAVAPLPEVPAVAPLPPAPAEAPLPLAPAVGPLPEVPAVAPLPQAPAVAPLPQAPAVAPLPLAPAVAPLPEVPAVAPLPQAPAAGFQNLEQQAGPVDQIEPRPSFSLPGVRGGSKIYTDGDGFYYHAEQLRNNRRQLKCTQRRISGCLARASMGLQENSPIIPTHNSPFHNHLPDYAKGDRLKLLNTLKERAREERGVAVSNIFAEEAVRNPDAAVAVSRINATRIMRREKKKTEPPTPQSVQELHEILNNPRYTYMQSTEDGSSDFHLQNFTNDNGEILATGFGSRRVVHSIRDHPAEATTLFMDATFKVVPRRPQGLRQLFSIHVLYMNVVFPVAFFLMCCQTEEAYLRILQWVRQHLITWDVTTIITDFERALINAVRQVFFGAEHHGCWFHYCQAIWRSAIRFGLANPCRQNPLMMRVIKMIMALPHLPPRRGPPNSATVPSFSIRDGLNEIIRFIDEGQLDPRLHNIVAYVRRFWIRRIGTETFSVFNLPRRTNNNLESFHARLLATSGPHNSIWVFIRSLQHIEQATFDDFQRVENGIEVRRHRIRPNRLNSPAIREAIRLLILREITLVHFLRRLAHRVDTLINVLAHPQQAAQDDFREEELAALEEGDLDGDLAEDPNPIPQPQAIINIPAPAHVGPPPQEDDEGGPPIPPLPVAVAPQRRGRRGRPRGVARGGRGDRGRGARGRGGRQGRPRGRGPRGHRGRGGDDPDDPPAGPVIPPVQLCSVCMINLSTHIVVPCGHLCMCQACADELPHHQDEQRCPMCNTPSHRFIRVYF